MMKTLIYLAGCTDEEIKTQYQQCMSLIEARMNKTLDEEIETRHLRKLKQKTAVSATVKDTLRIRIVADRADRADRDGASAGEIVSKSIEGADEMIIATARAHILNAAQIKEYLRRVGKITIASKRISFEQGASSEHVHRTLAMLKTRKTTYNDEEILRDEWTGGRPPIATEVVDGQLIKADDFHDTRELIHRVVFDGLSKSEASRQIGCTRKTITNTINRRYELFDIPQQ